MDFTLASEDAEVLRHLASVEPIEARRYLQDRPELTRRMLEWPPEIRLEVCRILHRALDESQRARLRERRRPGSSLPGLLEDPA